MRARNTQTIQVARQWINILNSYFAYTPSFDINNATPWNGLCIGSPADYPATDDFAEGECVIYEGESGKYHTSDAFYNSVKSVAGTASAVTLH